MRRIINQFKEPIYKEDLLNVIKYGLVYMIAFSILAGALNFLLLTISGVQTGLLIYFVAFVMSKQACSKIFNYHISYPLILTIFFIFGLVIYYITLYAFYTREIFGSIGFVLSNLFTIVFPYLNPFAYAPSNILSNIIDLLVVVISVMTIWRFLLTKK